MQRCPSNSRRLAIDAQVRAPPRLGQKGARGRPAKTSPARHLGIADPLLLRAVIIGGERKPDLLRGFDKAVGQGQDRPIILDEERAALAAILRTSRHVMLGFLEMGKDVRIALAAVSHLRPTVVIGRITADIEHAVDRAGAAQHLAARPMQ